MMWKSCLLTPDALTWATHCRHCDVLCVFSMLTVEVVTPTPQAPRQLRVFVCGIEAERGWKARSHRVAKLVRQIPVTSATFAPLCFSDRALRTAAFSVICLLPICITLYLFFSLASGHWCVFLSSFFPFWPFCSTFKIFMTCIKFRSFLRQCR